MNTRPVTGRRVGNQDGQVQFAKVCDLPEYLTAADGRVFRIRSWAPMVAYDSLVTVTAEMTIEVPEE